MPDASPDDLVARAARFAAAAHGAIDQRRKYSGEPYIVHPEAVAAVVAGVTDDQAMIAAAWLHDVAEDTPVTLEEIGAEFGPDVQSLVADLTNTSKPSDGVRAERKAIDRRHTADASPRAKTIKLADVIVNLTGVVRDDARFARVYLPEKESLLRVLGEGDPTLLQRARAVLKEEQRLLRQPMN